jgi:hypothetical protein
MDRRAERPLLAPIERASPEKDEFFSTFKKTPLGNNDNRTGTPPQSSSRESSRMESIIFDAVEAGAKSSLRASIPPLNPIPSSRNVQERL